MRILILGGTGFIGSHVVDALLNDGHYVKVLDRTLKHTHNKYPHLVEYIQADFGDSLVILEVLTGIDVVIHLVSSTVPGTSNLDPVADIQSNLINSVKLFKVMHQANVKRIIFFSSGGTVYGNPIKTPISESHPTHPISSYGVTKLAIENYLYMYQQLYGFDVTIFRPSNPYGPGQTRIGVQGVIGTCISSALSGNPITIWGDGSVVRDYIYISDVTKACTAAIYNKETGIFNIGSGIGYSITDIIDIVQRVSGRTIQVINKPKRDFDIEKVILDHSFATAKLKWQPVVDLPEGVKRTINWMET